MKVREEETALLLPSNRLARSVAIAIFFLLSAILIGSGYWYYHAEKKELTAEKYETLAAIGELKSKQIAQWRKERLAEADRATKDARMRKAIAIFLKDPGSPDFQRALRECVQEEVTLQAGACALLHDTNGKLLISNCDATCTQSEATLKAIRDAIAGNRSVFSDLYPDSAGVVHIDLAAPIVDENGQPMAVLILRHEAGAFLYPLIQSWPTPSHSAETTLIQRDGDEVVFLNGLRHRSAAALSLRRPLSDTDSPAVQAILGKRGIFEGNDYRGIAVISDLQPVPDSPWFVVAKVDEAEILAELRFRAGVITLIIGLSLVLAGGMVAFFYRERQNVILKKLVHAERERAAHEESFRGLFEHMTEGCAYCQMIFENGQPRDWIYLSVNRAFERITGLKGVTGKRATEVIPGIREADPGLFEAYGRVAQTGQPEKFEMFIASLGEWFSVSVYSPEKGFFVANFEMVTIRKKAEQERKWNEEKYRSILRTAMDGFCLLDEQGCLREVNAAYCRMIGYSEEELLTMHISDLDDKMTGEEVSATIRKIIAEGEGRFESRHRRKDGSHLFVEVSVQFRHSDRLLVAFHHDITKRKSMEAQLLDARNRAEAGNRAKSEFLAVMSHELRTPLNGVLGFIEILADTHLDREQREHLKTIEASGRHLLSIVNDILDFFSIEKGSLRIEAAMISTPALIETCCEITRQSTADKGLAFRCEIAPGVPETIVGDARRIRQILLNLLGNAAKFTVRGSVNLHIAPTLDGTRELLKFSVEDTGPGIAPDTLPNLFKPFTQAETSLHRSFEGTGLGLAISLRLAEGMGGTIEVDSTPGKGSTFAFLLPLDVVASPAAAGSAPAASLPLPAIPSGQNLVLVVEDDRVNAMLAENILKKIGMQVEFAANGRKAVEAFSPGKYFAIFMDMQMPVMDGLEAAAKIRGIESATDRRVPIIALTANVMPGDRDRCLAAGMDDFLTKPFNRDQIAAIIAAIITRR